MHKRHLSFLFTLCVVAALLVCPAFAQQGAPMKTVKIGVISPLSGPLTFVGTSMLRCVQMAVKEINEKGTTGNGPGLLVGKDRYKVEIVNYDDSADPAKSVAGMRKLVEMYKVPVILGPFGSPQVFAAQEVNQGLKVLFNGLSTSDDARRKGNALYIQERVPGLYFGDAMAEACYRERLQEGSRTHGYQPGLCRVGQEVSAEVRKPWRAGCRIREHRHQDYE